MLRNAVSLDPEVLAQRLLGEACQREDLLWAVRPRPHRFFPTLASHQLRAGGGISARAAAVLTDEMERLGRYDEVESHLKDLFPDIHPLRGSLIRGLYPDSLLRHQADIDLFCPSQETVWAAVADLVKRGWAVSGLWVAIEGETTYLSVVLEHPHENRELAHPDRVELLTRPFEGDYWRIDPRDLVPGSAPALVYSLLALLDEGVGRSFGCRDVYDAHLLLTAITGSALLGRLAKGIHQVLLWPEWTKMAVMLEAAGWPPPTLAGPSLGIRLRRAAGPVRHLAHPIRFCVLGCAHLVRRRESRTALRVLWLAQRWLGARALLRRGIPMFGVQVLEESVSEPVHSALTATGPYAELKTPVGTFALSAGGDIPWRWLPAARASADRQ